jgi:hypothetical protein
MSALMQQGKRGRAAPSQNGVHREPHTIGGVGQTKHRYRTKISAHVVKGCRIRITAHGMIARGTLLTVDGASLPTLCASAVEEHAQMTSLSLIQFLSLRRLTKRQQQQMPAFMLPNPIIMCKTCTVLSHILPMGAKRVSNYCPSQMHAHPFNWATQNSAHPACNIV